MIRKHTDRKGRTSYGVRVYRNGKREWVGTFPTLDQARRAQAKAILRSTPTRLTVDAWVERFLKGYAERHKTSSWETAANVLAGFRRDFRDRSLTTITRDEAEEWAQHNRWRLNVVVTCMNAAVKEGHIEASPFAGMTHKSRGRKDLEPLTEKELQRLSEASSVLGNYAPTMKALILFAAYTGMRESELFGLEWRDIDFKANRVHVRRQWYRGRMERPKANQTRLIALLPQARDALAGLPRRSEVVFPAKKAPRLSTNTFNATYWPSVCASYGRKLHFHELRHFAAHFLYVRMDLPSRVVAAQLGHSSPRMVEDIYSHWKVGVLEDIDRAVGTNVRRLREAEGA